jgi:broad specificity phosphatase PhoE
MSRVYLIRHGQAGTRQSYDSLSALGIRQAKLAGEYLARSGVRFAHAYSGALLRQQQTGKEFISGFSEAGLDFPALTIDPGWNEFDLDHVYRQLAPVLCEEDQAFRAEFEIQRAELEAAGEKHDAEVHRRWTPSDMKIMQTWIKGHPRFEGETWQAFRHRIAGRWPALAATAEQGDDHNIVVFTSATPIGILAALGMDVEDHRSVRLAGVLYNASITIMRVRQDQIRLHTFNGVPHLDPSLCTYR